MKDYPLVSIVVVNYNGKKYLKGCFNSLYNLNYPKNKLEIIMVDNGSSDDSVEFMNKNFPQVKIISNDVNNYCKANNLGIKRAKGTFIALVNNDIKLDKDWQIELIRIINQDKSIGAVTSKILFPDGRLQSTGHHGLPSFYWSDRGFKEEDRGQYNETEEVSSISHCATLYRKKCLDNIGLLDEDFNMYMEDVDMSIRVRKKGWRLLYVPKSVAYHEFHGSADDNRVDFWCERNRLLLIAKHYPTQLAEALFGKGYFTILNNKNELLKILPDVFNKLLKHHDTTVIISILPDIFENLNKILNLEKDHLIKQLDLEKNQIDSLREAISQKDQCLRYKDQEIARLNNEINQHLDLVFQKEQEISNLKEKIDQTLNLISQKDQLLQHKDKEIVDLNDKINQIYDSETYRFIARPIWIFLNFIKRIKSVFPYRRIYHLRRYKKNLCLAYFLAQSKVVKYKEPNCYNLKITNDTDEEHPVKIKINIENNDIVYTYFSKSLIIQPKSSMEVIIDYDWQVEAVFYVNDRKLTSDELHKKDFDSSGFYSLSAILSDIADIQIDKLTIFQRLDL